MKRLPGSALLIGGMVLAPYTALFVPFQLGLLLQAAVIVVVLAAAGWAGRRELVDRARPVPWPVRVGLGLYAAAAVWGAAVGFLAGNPTRFVVSQFLAMALLPAGALAFAARRDLDGSSIVAALAWAALVALAVHCVALAVPGLGGEVSGHYGFDLRNGVGFGAVAPLLWLLGLANAPVASWRRSTAVPGIAAILCLWAQSRGAWASVAVGTMALIVLASGLRTRVVAVASSIAFVVIALVVGSLAVIPRNRGGASAGVVGGTPLRIDPRAGAGSSLQVGAPQPFEGAALDVAAESHGDDGTSLWVWAEFTDAAGGLLATRQAEVVGRGRWMRWEVVLAAPPGARAVRAGIRIDPHEGAWLVDGFGVEALRSGIEALGRQLRVRGASLATVIEDPLADSALSYRVSETRAVRAAWDRAGLGRRLAGFGLGATFAFPNASFDDEGRRIVLPEASYIHDFYLFLGFKLGLAGAVALGGLALIFAWTARAALAARRRPLAQWFLAGATAGWVAYLAWSVTSPEIYDFRMAPLWGALVAISCREAERRDAERTGRESPARGAERRR